MRYLIVTCKVAGKLVCRGSRVGRSRIDVWFKCRLIAKCAGLSDMSSICCCYVRETFSLRSRAGWGGLGWKMEQSSCWKAE